MITRGVGPDGVPPPSQPQPAVVIVVGPLPTFPATIYENGLTAQIASGRRNLSSVVARSTMRAMTFSLLRASLPGMWMLGMDFASSPRRYPMENSSSPPRATSMLMIKASRRPGNG